MYTRAIPINTLCVLYDESSIRTNTHTLRIIDTQVTYLFLSFSSSFSLPFFAFFLILSFSFSLLFSPTECIYGLNIFSLFFSQWPITSLITLELLASNERRVSPLRSNKLQENGQSIAFLSNGLPEVKLKIKKTNKFLLFRL